MRLFVGLLLLRKARSVYKGGAAGFDMVSCGRILESLRTSYRIRLHLLRPNHCASESFYNRSRFVLACSDGGRFRKEIALSGDGITTRKRWRLLLAGNRMDNRCCNWSLQFFCSPKRNLTMPSRKYVFWRGVIEVEIGGGAEIISPKPMDENLLFNEGSNRTALMTPVPPRLKFAYKAYSRSFEHRVLSHSTSLSRLTLNCSL